MSRITTCRKRMITSLSPFIFLPKKTAFSEKEKAAHLLDFLFYSCLKPPVFARTLTSAYFLISLSFESKVPTTPPIKPSGMETMAGLVSGKIGVPVIIAAPASGFITLGLIETRTNAEIKPVKIAEMAPVVLNFFQKIV